MFLPHKVPFPKLNLQDHLTQAAEDIIIILTPPPNSTAPSLREGDPIRNNLLDISQQLKRVENIPEPTAAVQQSKNWTDATIQLPHNRAPTPRVDATKQSAPDTTRDAPPLRVEEPTPTPVSVLQQHSKLQKTRGSKIHQNTFTRSVRNNDDCTPYLPSNGYKRMHDGIALAPTSVIKRSNTWWHHRSSIYTQTIYTTPMEEKKSSTRYYKEAIDTYERKFWAMSGDSWRRVTATKFR